MVRGRTPPLGSPATDAVRCRGHSVPAVSTAWPNGEEEPSSEAGARHVNPPGLPPSRPASEISFRALALVSVADGASQARGTESPAERQTGLHAWPRRPEEDRRSTRSQSKRSAVNPRKLRTCIPGVRPVCNSSYSLSRYCSCRVSGRSAASPGGGPLRVPRRLRPEKECNR